MKDDRSSIMASPRLLHKHGPRFVRPCFASHGQCSAHAISCAILPGMPLDRWWDGMIRAEQASSASSGALIVSNPSCPHLVLWKYRKQRMQIACSHAPQPGLGVFSAFPACVAVAFLCLFSIRLRANLSPSWLDRKMAQASPALTSGWRGVRKVK